MHINALYYCAVANHLDPIESVSYPTVLISSRPIILCNMCLAVTCPMGSDRTETGE